MTRALEVAGARGHMCVIVLDQREAAPPMRDGLHVCGRGVKGDGLVDALLLGAGPGPSSLN